MPSPLVLLHLLACVTATVADRPAATEPVVPPVPVPTPTAPPTETAPDGTLAAWPAVVINEILPANDSIAMDEGLDFDDFVELYNASGAAVDLTGWGLADDTGEPDWTFPIGELLEPGAHRVIWLDDEPDEGPLHASVGVDADGDTLALFAPDGTVVDVWTFADQPDDVVLGRFPSGGPFRASSIVATPGNANPIDPGLSLDPSDALYPDGGLVRIDLYLDDAAMAELGADTTAVVPAGIGFEGAYQEVTVTIKGGWGSLRSLDQKAAFRVDLDGLVAGQRLRGLENLTLNSMVQDPSGVHEMLGYALLREAGVPAPRIAHVELWMNGAYRGLYLNVETPDDQFLQRWFDDPDGNLYEGAYGQDLTSADQFSLELDEQGAADPTDRSELDPLIALLTKEPTEERMVEFEALVDLDRTLPMLAGEVVLAHWDGYFYYPNNWRAYHEPTTGKVTLLAWGLDQTFGYAGGIHSASGDAASWCLDVPSCRTRFDLALWDMADRLAAHGCEARVAAVLPTIVPLYREDPFREATPADMESQASAAVDFCSWFPASVLAELF